MGKLIITIMSVLFISSALAAEGVVTLKSAHGVSETADRLESALKDKGMTVFDRIDHAAGAKKVGMTLRPTLLVIFGNPKSGTPLMLCGQTVAIDLPQKALIWEDADGQVWVTYNDPRYLARRHGITGCEKVLEKIEGALNKLATTAASP